MILALSATINQNMFLVTSFAAQKRNSFQNSVCKTVYGRQGKTVTSKLEPQFTKIINVYYKLGQWEINIKYIFKYSAYQTESLNALNMNEICTALDSQASHQLHQLCRSYSVFCCGFRHPAGNGHHLDFHPLAHRP